MGRQSYLIILLFILLSTSALMAGTTGKIAGTVKDAKTGEPLPGANILIVGTSIGAASNIEGQFFILNVPPSSYDLKITMMGYKATILKSIRIKIDQTTDADILLEPTVIEGEEVTVLAEKPKVELDLT
ncbi:MAG: carboxypeptidase-like regulatory domain-containing protein, partial [Candidatus Hodarchaeota archaeon]